MFFVRDHAPTTEKFSLATTNKQFVCKDGSYFPVIHCNSPNSGYLQMFTSSFRVFANGRFYFVFNQYQPINALKFRHTLSKPEMNRWPEVTIKSSKLMLAMAVAAAVGNSRPYSSSEHLGFSYVSFLKIFEHRKGKWQVTYFISKLSQTTSNIAPQKWLAVFVLKDDTGWT